MIGVESVSVEADPSAVIVDGSADWGVTTRLATGGASVSAAAGGDPDATVAISSSEDAARAIPALRPDAAPRIIDRIRDMATPLVPRPRTRGGGTLHQAPSRRYFPCPG